MTYTEGRAHEGTSFATVVSSRDGRPETCNDKRPRAIFFDVGETLVRPRSPYAELLAETSRQLGIALPDEVFSGLSDRIETRVLERSQRGIPFTYPPLESQRFWHETYYRFFMRYLPEGDALLLAQRLLELLSSPSGYELFEDALPTLEQLRVDGFRLGVISNWEAWLPTLLDAVSLTSLFDYFVISGVCGVEKPDPRIFTLALGQNGYRTDEVIYVGDRPAHDVYPAQSLGIRAILLDREGRFRTPGAYRHIGSLNDLPEVLRHLTLP